jgi:hypothetical protein
MPSERVAESLTATGDGASAAEAAVAFRPPANCQPPRHAPHHGLLSAVRGSIDLACIDALAELNPRGSPRQVTSYGMDEMQSVQISIMLHFMHRCPARARDPRVRVSWGGGGVCVRACGACACVCVCGLVCVLACVCVLDGQSSAPPLAFGRRTHRCAQRIGRGRLTWGTGSTPIGVLGVLTWGTGSTHMG